KKDVNITATETEIKISAETKDRKYQKSIPLNAEIDPKKTTARYNNGILEIKAPLRHKEEHTGHSVKVT
ncbi:MAG: Hsp20 family protein, partial [Candidatus Hydrothermarchaeaceae archaeon]